MRGCFAPQHTRAGFWRAYVKDQKILLRYAVRVVMRDTRLRLLSDSSRVQRVCRVCCNNGVGIASTNITWFCSIHLSQGLVTFSGIRLSQFAGSALPE